MGVMREGCVAGSVTPLAVHGPRHQHRGDTSSQGWGWTASDSSRWPSEGLNHRRKQPLPGCWGSQSCLLQLCTGTYGRCAPTELAVGFLEKRGSSGAPKASPKDQIRTTSLSWKREKTQYAASSNDRHVAHTGRCQKMLTSALPAAPCSCPGRVGKSTRAICLLEPFVSWASSHLRQNRLQEQPGESCALPPRFK